MKGSQRYSITNFMKIVCLVKNTVSMQIRPFRSYSAKYIFHFFLSLSFFFLYKSCYITAWGKHSLRMHMGSCLSSFPYSHLACLSFSSGVWVLVWDLCSVPTIPPSFLFLPYSYYFHPVWVLPGEAPFSLLAANLSPALCNSKQQLQTTSGCMPVTPCFSKLSCLLCEC